MLVKIAESPICENRADVGHSAQTCYWLHAGR